MSAGQATARIVITGASGSGTTTLGKVLAEKLGCPHFDVDEYFWLPTDPPFRKKRSTRHMQAPILADVGDRPAWTISGSSMKWANVIERLMDLVVYLSVPTPTRVARLRARASARFAGRVEPGGDMYESSQDFLRWAAAYEEGPRGGWGRADHEQWLAGLLCPVLRLEREFDLEDGVERVLQAFYRNNLRR